MITYDHRQYGPQPSWTWYLATWYCLFACASAAFLCELADTGTDTFDLLLRSAPRKGLQCRWLNLALPDLIYIVKTGLSSVKEFIWGKILPLQLANEKVSEKVVIQIHSNHGSESCNKGPISTLSCKASPETYSLEGFTSVGNCCSRPGVKSSRSSRPPS